MAVAGGGDSGSRGRRPTLLGVPPAAARRPLSSCMEGNPRDPQHLGHSPREGRYAGGWRRAVWLPCSLPWHPQATEKAAGPRSGPRPAPTSASTFQPRTRPRRKRGSMPRRNREPQKESAGRGREACRPRRDGQRRPPRSAANASAAAPAALPPNERATALQASCKAAMTPGQRTGTEGSGAQQFKR